MSYSVPTAKDVCTSGNYVYIASLEDLYMDINISEEQINKISIGQEVEIVANFDENKIYKGTITKINAIGTHSSGGTTFAAIASIENDDTLKLGMSANCTVTIEKNENLPCLPIEAVIIENNGNLKIGMSASCEIIIEKAENVVAVPLEAVQTSDDGKYVIVVNDDGSTSEVSVETGISNDAYIQIKSGISEDTTVQMIESSTSSQTSGGMGFEKSSFRGGMSESSNFNGGAAPTEMRPNMP